MVRRWIFSPDHSDAKHTKFLLSSVGVCGDRMGISYSTSGSKCEVLWWSSSSTKGIASVVAYWFPVVWLLRVNVNSDGGQACTSLWFFLYFPWDWRDRVLADSFSRELMRCLIVYPDFWIIINQATKIGLRNGHILYWYVAAKRNVCLSDFEVIHCIGAIWLSSSSCFMFGPVFWKKCSYYRHLWSDVW